MKENLLYERKLPMRTKISDVKENFQIASKKLPSGSGTYKEKCSNSQVTGSVASLDPDRVAAGVCQLLRCWLLHNAPLSHAHRRLLIHIRVQVENDKGNGCAHDGPLLRLRRHLSRLQLRVVRMPHLRCPTNQDPTRPTLIPWRTS